MSPREFTGHAWGASERDYFRDMDEDDTPVLRCGCGEEITRADEGECEECWTERIAEKYEAEA